MHHTSVKMHWLTHTHSNLFTISQNIRLVWKSRQSAIGKIGYANIYHIMFRLLQYLRLITKRYVSEIKVYSGKIVTLRNEMKYLSEIMLRLINKVNQRQSIDWYDKCIDDIRNGIMTGVKLGRYLKKYFLRLFTDHYYKK